MIECEDIQNTTINHDESFLLWIDNYQYDNKSATHSKNSILNSPKYDYWIGLGVSIICLLLLIFS